MVPKWGCIELRSTAPDRDPTDPKPVLSLSDSETEEGSSFSEPVSSPSNGVRIEWSIRLSGRWSEIMYVKTEHSQGGWCEMTYENVYLPTQINACSPINVLIFIQENVPEPSCRRGWMRIPAVGISILPSQLICPIYLPPQADSLRWQPLCPHPPAWRGLQPAMTLTFPGFLVKQPQEESEHQHVILGRKTTLGTAGDKMYKPGPAMCGGQGGGRRKGGERTGLPLITTSFRNPSLTTYKLCELGTRLNLFESY